MESKYYNSRFRFELDENTQFKRDDNLYVVGNTRELGSWDHSKALKLNWNSEKTLSLANVSLSDQPSQYKYFCVGPDGKKKWEDNENRSVNVLVDRTKGEPIEICYIDGLNSSTKVNVSRKQWWKESVVYQIYPRSFCDSNGDGVGDLRGIISKLDYLKELGVDVIWLSPVYKSPNDDNGYDISDYLDINPEFGTMDEMEQLLAEAHKRNIKIVMDLVVNHTSDEHFWFQEAKKSKDNPYRDYYIWKSPNPETGKEPTNWVSFFGGSTWEFDEATGEYYLHLFTKKQPDLNWENPKVREEVWKMMDTWLKKGIDGFRMDVINVISKDPEFPPAPVNRDGDFHWAGEHFVGGPKMADYLQEMKERVLSKYDIMTVGETPFFTIEDGARITNEETGAVNMLFHFELMMVDSPPGGEKWEYKPWDLKSIRQVMDRWQTELQGKGWNSLYLENHDQPRSISRFGNDKEYHKESAKMLATWLHMMQGTPYIYQGQEIGMTNVPFETIDKFKDVESLNYHREAVNDRKIPESQVLDSIRRIGRDNARTPFQWSGTNNGGFSSGRPWIDVNPNYKQINAESQLNDPDSIFNYYRQLIQLRKKHPIVVYGDFHPVNSEHEKIYSYIRKLDRQVLLVIVNFSSDTPQFNLDADRNGHNFSEPELLISNYSVETNSKTESFESFMMRPYEARVYLLNDRMHAQWR